MPLELYKRGKTYYFKGRIDELPSSKYYRQSTGKTAQTSALAALNYFRQEELRRFYAGEDVSFTFSQAVLEYRAKPEFAKALLPIVQEIGHMELKRISPVFVRGLGRKLQPNNSTDTWQKRIVSPIRAVINNAHDMGLCPPIKITSYSESERLEQDGFRGKTSRDEIVPGSWPWIMDFKAAAPLHLGLLAQFMFETGARISQATTVTVDGLDAANNQVWMPEAKGIKAQWVSLSAELVAELTKLEPRYTNRASGKKIKSDRLFGYLGRGSVYKTWKRVCRDANIEVILPHAAGRHGFGTELMIRQKLDPVTVAKAGRWSDPTMLLKTYAHPEESQKKAQEALRTGRVQAESESATNSLKGKENDE
jgi:hypothetical protein